MNCYCYFMVKSKTLMHEKSRFSTGETATGLHYLAILPGDSLYRDSFNRFLEDIIHLPYALASTEDGARVFCQVNPLTQSRGSHSLKIAHTNVSQWLLYTSAVSSPFLGLGSTICTASGAIYTTIWTSAHVCGLSS